MIPRRRFIKQSGFAVTSLLAGNALLGACSKRPQESKIGLQLFTMRDDLAEDAKKTLMKIANIGYGHVETFYDYQNNKGSGKFWNLSTGELKKILADNNLRSFSGHYTLNSYLTMGKGNDDELKQQVEIAANLGQQYFVIPVPPMQLLDKLTLPDFQFMAEQLNRGGEYCKQAGLKIGYHNHFWEFRGNEEDNQTGYEILLNQTEPDLVTFELDLFWTVKSGIDPVELFNNYPKRFEMWHVKDIDQSKPEVIVGHGKDALPSMEILGDIRFTEVGNGTIDFKTIFKAADKAGLSHFFVEQDGIYMDNHYESIRRSFHYVKENLI
ncbi:sugar phosphate isomerase/epimerase [Olivibacter sp. SDN3]|uniref:sugar phosphate isomerase/epimerase family protein n=1 Tax=Olivibacter sp. SDN3 TaxID=2764720 RepID=UPI001651A413|nr:sugar phosphate isomerase/epimerase [Olivibacter sp. SDN3]QNL49269.1 sugar phosphate isomerase/epimerase [Olivibacter sp. SDN3]